MNNKLDSKTFVAKDKSYDELKADAKKFVNDTLGENPNIRVMAPKRAHVGDVFSVTGVRFVELTNGDGTYRPASFTTSMGSQIPANCFASFVDLGDFGPTDVTLAAFMLRDMGTQFIIESDSPEWQKEREIETPDPNAEGGVRKTKIDGYLRHDWKVALYTAPAANNG